MAIDIAGALGIGSGINTTQLVADLVNAAYQPKQSVVSDRLNTNNARISALASAKSALNTFSTALSELLQSSSYSGQPVSNDPSIASVSLIKGGVPKGLPAQIEVLQLARGQVLQSAPLGAATDVAGTGSLTLTIGSKSTAIALTAPQNTLADLAGAINAANTGVTAAIVTDQAGARLVLKGATGVDQAFTLTANGDADADLQRFSWDGAAGGLARSQTAQNALIRIDNVDMEYGANEITTAIPFVRIDLNKAAPGTTVTLATDQPAATMGDLVREFVSAYNELKKALNGSMTTADGASGLLASDAGMREMAQRLATLVSAPLSATGPYKTLADIGVRTERDGTLSLDSARLDAALAADPEAVTQMLNPSVKDAGHPGIAGALKNVTDYLNRTDGALASSQASYEKLKTSLAKQLEALDRQRDDYAAQLTKTYAAMQARLVQFKATQSYLEQQIKVWNGGKD
ncbi:MAG TPA: flagellar filament capping protein FliD [Sphingobium sp.]|nr:flagellar filament capping protein FliD [Sphingobium sp.]